MAFGFLKDLFDRFSGKPVDWDELEESLIRADIDVPMTLEIIKALLFVIKDTPQEVPASTRFTAQDTLEFILRACCAG